MNTNSPNTHRLGRSKEVLESQAPKAGEPLQAYISAVEIFWSPISYGRQN